MAILDLRFFSVALGGSRSLNDQTPLQIDRYSKQLTIELPIGSKRGPRDLTILSNTGTQVPGASGTAELHDHNVPLR